MTRLEFLFAMNQFTDEDLADFYEDNNCGPPFLLLYGDMLLGWE
jgi:hypothetical protein